VELLAVAGVSETEAFPETALAESGAELPSLLLVQANTEAQMSATAGNLANTD
jgi:hypothetical protein